MAIIADMFRKLIPGKKTGHVETSLIEEFSYPKLGPGQLWDVTGAEIEKMGGRILRNCRVVRLHRDDKNHLTSLTYEKTVRNMRKPAIFSSPPCPSRIWSAA